jgi:lipopolysaccharide export system permease protein
MSISIIRSFVTNWSTAASHGRLENSAPFVPLEKSNPVYLRIFWAKFVVRWLFRFSTNIVRVAMLEPDRMSLLGLIQYTRHLRENNQNAERYQIALWKKIVYPLAVVVMMTLALPFGYLQVRAGSIGYKVFAGIMLGVTFHFMNGLFSHLGLLNTWPAWLSVSIPSLVALAVALTMLARVGRMR